MLIDLKSLSLKIRTQQSREAAIMHHPATHGDGGDAGSIASGNDCARESLCNCGMEAGRDAGFAGSSVYVLQQFMPQPREADDDGLFLFRIRAVKLDFIAIEGVRFFQGNTFKFDGRLRLVVDSA